MKSEKLANYILKEFSERQDRNSSYSLRALAKDLQVSPATLSQFLNGKRSLSSKMTKSICKNLSLPLEEWLEEEKGTTKLKHTNQLPMAAYKIVADWEYYAILNLMETSDFRSDSQWIAQRLALSKTKVESCLQTLFDFDLIEETDGSLRRTQSSLRTSEDISNISLQSRHKKNLEEARRALAEVPVELREFSSMTMAIDSSKMSLAKKRIADFFEELSSELETGNQDEVYELAVQLFPRTNITRRKK